MVGVAHAQPTTPEPPPQPALPPTPEAPPPPPAVDPAWSAYDDAFSRAATGDVTAANTQLTAISTQWPQHPAATLATGLVAESAPKPVDPNAPSKVARGELVFWSTLSGVMIGANTCVMVNCSTDREYAGVYMLTVGGSLAASVFATRNGIHNGEAQLYNSAQTWGAWNGLAINNDFASTRDQASVALGMQAAGLGAGLALWQTWRPTDGDVALTNTFWVWSSVMSAWGHIAADAIDNSFFRRTVVIGDVAIVAGAVLSTQVKVSRGRTFLIDIGGVLGIMGGGLVAVGSNSDEAVGTALLVGTGLGLGLATVFTNDWDAPKVPNVSVSPAAIAGPQSTGFGVAAGRSF